MFNTGVIIPFQLGPQGQYQFVGNQGDVILKEKTEQFKLVSGELKKAIGRVLLGMPVKDEPIRS